MHNCINLIDPMEEISPHVFAIIKHKHQIKCRSISNDTYTVDGISEIADIFISRFCIFNNSSNSIFFSTNFSVVQMVTAGNGIKPIEVVLSSKLTITGRRCHFVQILQIAPKHIHTDRENAIVHQSLL